MSRNRTTLTPFLLLIAMLVAAAAPASARATDLMVEHFGPVEAYAPGWADVRPAALRAADYMGARYARLIVERRTWSTGFDWNARDYVTGTSVREFVADARVHEMRPYLTLTGVKAGNGDEAAPSPSAFGDWCAEAAATFNGEVSDFSVWNEPNLTGGNYLSPAEYRSYYTNCYNKIKTVQPAANVFIGELETASGAAGGSCQYFHTVANSASAPIKTDGLALHPYQFTTAPEVADSTPCKGIGNLPAWRLALGHAVHYGRLVSPGRARPMLIVSEFGYCTERPPVAPGVSYNDFSALAACGQQTADGVRNAQLDEATRADWIRRAFNWASAPPNEVDVFDYHGIARRNPYDFAGNERCPVNPQNPKSENGRLVCSRPEEPTVYYADPRKGYLWNSGLVEFFSPYTLLPSVQALHEASGARAPRSSTIAGVDLRAKSATLQAEIDPEGWKTTYRFEYGTDTSYGQTTPLRETVGGAVNARVDLLADTTYHFRVVATNRVGTTVSEDHVLTTLPMPRPAAIVDPDGDVHVFFRGLNGQLLEWRWADDGWRSREWGSSGAMAGDPAVVVLRSGRIEVFYRSTDGYLDRFWIEGGRSGLEQHEFPGRIQGDPAAVVTPAGRVEVFYRYEGGLLRRIWFEGGVGYTLNEEPGAVVGDPAVVVSAAGRLEVFYRYRGGVMRRH